MMNYCFTADDSLVHEVGTSPEYTKCGIRTFMAAGNDNNVSGQLCDECLSARVTDDPLTVPLCSPQRASYSVEETMDPASHNPANDRVILTVTREELETLDYAMMVTADQTLQEEATLNSFNSVKGKIADELRVLHERDERRRKTIELLKSGKFPIKGVPEGTIDAAVEEMRSAGDDDE